jgi:hypothetical protein
MVCARVEGRFLDVKGERKTLCRNGRSDLSSRLKRSAFAL